MITIYLADLTHCTMTISNDAFPLNVGLVGAYTKKIFPDVHIELFKYPDDLKKAIDRKKPDILGCSNYPWNFELGVSFLKYVKDIDKNIITVMGGPNISYNNSDQHQLLHKLKGILDFHTLYEGESAFRSLLEQIFANDFNLRKIKEASISGCVYLIGDELQEYNHIERKRNLTEFPSPYLTGLMDKFFDNLLSPIFETHRGCPFSCTYCHEGHKSYDKVNRHEINRIFDEIEYISTNIGNQVKNLMIADPNFGMFREDIQIAERIREIYEKTGYPNVIFATTAKNKKERLIEISKVLTPVSMPIWLSVQSMTDNVLENIKRKNIRIGDLVGVQKELQKENIPSQSELIMCLPGERFETHLDSLIKLIELEIDRIVCYQLMLIQGAELKQDELTRGKHSFSTKFRVLPRNFSDIKNVGRSIETEEIVVATNDFSFEDYLKARQLHLLLSIYYNGKGFKGFFKYIGECQLDIRTFIDSFLDIFTTEAEFTELLTSFLDETKKELFNNEDDLRQYYSYDENFKNLASGSAGANLLQKYTCLFYMEKSHILTEIISKAMYSLVPDNKEFYCKLDNIAKYYQLSFNNFLAPNRKEILTKDYFDFNIADWLIQTSKGLDNFKYNEKKEIVFHTSDKQYEVVESYFKRYGRNAQAFGKVMTRLWIVDMLRIPIK